MPIVAFTFGSVGDIIAVVQLLDQVRRALCDSTGSSAEYQALIRDLDVFADILDAVEHAFHTPVYKPAGRGGVPPTVANAHRQALQTSFELLCDVEGRIGRYKACLKRGGSGSMMRDSWRKVGWALFKKAELQDLRRRVMDQVEVMHILLSLQSRWESAEHKDTLANVDRSVKDLPVILGEQSSVLGDIQRSLKTLPNALGYPWEGGLTPLQQPVVLTDAWGQSARFPIELCLSRKTFIDILRIYSKNRPGTNHVERGDFVITRASDVGRVDEPLLDTNWATLIQPGSTLNMDVIIWQQYEGKERKFSRTHFVCPNCRHDNQKEAPHRGGLTCARCQIWFFSTFSVVQQNRTPTGKSAHDEIVSPEVQDTTLAAREASGLHVLRRIRVVNWMSPRPPSANATASSASRRRLPYRRIPSPISA